MRGSQPSLHEMSILRAPRPLGSPFGVPPVSPARSLAPIRNVGDRRGFTPLPPMTLPAANSRVAEALPPSAAPPLDYVAQLSRRSNRSIHEDADDAQLVEAQLVEVPPRRYLQRPTWADPRLATVPSLSAPFHIEHAVNNLVVANLRKGFVTYIPIAYFASRFADSSIKPIESGESILIDDSGLKVKSKTFQDYALSKISMTDFASISMNLPRCIRTHFIPGGIGQVGCELSHSLADMFQGLFLMIQMRPDFEVSFEVYKEYVDRVLRQWHSYPETNTRVDLFHEGLFQMVFNMYQARSLSSSSSSSTSSSSSKPISSSGSSKQSKRSFRDGDDSKPGSRGSSRTPKNVCYVCLSSDHHWSAHKAKKTDHLKRIDKRFVDPEGHAYCLGFNGVSGCRHGSECNYEHKCGACGSSEHGSQEHPRQ